MNNYKTTNNSIDHNVITVRSNDNIIIFLTRTTNKNIINNQLQLMGTI